MVTTKTKKQQLAMTSYEKKFLHDLFDSATKVNVILNNVLKHSSKEFSIEEVYLLNRLSYLFSTVSKRPQEIDNSKPAKKLILINSFEKKLFYDLYDSAAIIYFTMNKVIQHSTAHFTTAEVDILNSLSILFSEMAKHEATKPIQCVFLNA